MTARVPGMRQVRMGAPTPRALADLGLLRRDDELVETLRLRATWSSGDRVTRLFHALLAEVDAGPAVRRAVSDRA
ncbi:hypothetical protein [Yinghuangia seranimata]|uniref:hypothetical protein n=1 Tax=Yinghuangia seranimata TaxID=408067 RepID=UPI00248CF89B|nr:hypothetical protein [Yinghuangia seranimata]MDI2126829.1 hypothetical protein [Yinghuangia seranimata]